MINVGKEQWTAISSHGVASHLGSADISSLLWQQLKKQANYLCYNYVKLPPNLAIFGTMMTNCLKLYNEVHSFSTSPNSRQCTTVLNADVQNCYITL